MLSSLHNVDEMHLILYQRSFQVQVTAILFVTTHSFASSCNKMDIHKTCSSILYLQKQTFSLYYLFHRLH